MSNVNTGQKDNFPVYYIFTTILKLKPNVIIFFFPGKVKLITRLPIL